ncbi:EF-hand calcium-binding domain-containing protein 13 [Carettochelys insculpta]|uniref:EF-hand calcium-binding domain-containing protein 13 n=1 Tax=Carettochelys insculpta TaxID=44489 RepID=UPI003EBF59FB
MWGGFPDFKQRLKSAGEQAEEEMELWEPLDPQVLPQTPLSSVMQAWQQPSNHGAATGKEEAPFSPAAEVWRQPRGSCPQAKRDSAQACPVRHVRRRQYVPKADKATEITPSFERMLKQRAASSRKKKSQDRGYGRTRPRRSTACSPSYPKQSFSQAPRRSKVLNNLYMNLYEEVGEDGPWAVQRVEGLPKACLVFSALRNGRIHVNDLLLTLHTLGILVTSTEMRKVLKSIDIEANGTLTFTDFLEALKETSPFAHTEAFQNTYQAFSKMKKGLIHVNDLQPALLSMGVGLNLETLQEVLKHIYVNTAALGAPHASLCGGSAQEGTALFLAEDGQLNIWDFLMAVSDLEHQYEDVESLGLYDTLKPRKPGHRFDFDAKSRARRRTRLSLDVKYLKKADTPQPDSSPAHQQKPLRAGDKSSSPRPRFLSFQEKLPTRFDADDSLEGSPKATKRYSTQRRLPWNTSIKEDSEEPLEEEESPFSQDSVHKSWQFRALQVALEIVSKIKADNVKVDELRCILQTMGIPLTDTEFQELLQKVTLEKDRTVDLKELMSALTGTRRFSQSIASQDAFNALSKISEDKIEVSSLPVTLKVLGIHLTPTELQEALTSCPADESGKVTVKEFLKVLTHNPGFSESGEDRKVNFKDILTSLANTKNFSELEVLQNATAAVSRVHGGRLHLDDLKAFLENLGLLMKEEELQEALKVVAVDEHRTVNLNEFLTVLDGLPHFTDSMVLQQLIGAFGRVKEDKVDQQDLDSVLASLGICVSSEELQKALQNISPDEAGKVNFKVLRNLRDTQQFSEALAVQEALDVVSKVEDNKIEVSHLQSALANMGIHLPTVELEEALRHSAVDGDGKVNFKDFLKGLASTKHLSRALEMEEAVKAIGAIKEETVDVQHLDSIMRKMGIHLTPEEIQKTLKHMTSEVLLLNSSLV